MGNKQMSFMSIIKAKNILDVPYGIIGHQVNCLGVMGSGVAASIKKAYPPVFNSYAKMCGLIPERRRYQLLGQVQFVTASEIEGKPLIFANIFSQLDTSCSSRQTEYGSLHRGLKTIEEKTRGLRLPIHFPYLIGCGAGGGDWNIVSEMIESVFENSDMDVHICAYNPEAEAEANAWLYPKVMKQFNSDIAAFKAWLYLPNIELSNAKPIDLIHLGRIDYLAEYFISKKPKNKPKPKKK